MSVMGWNAAKRAFSDKWRNPNWEYADALHRHLKNKGILPVSLPLQLRGLHAELRRRKFNKPHVRAYCKQGREVVKVSIQSLSDVRDPTLLQIHVTVGFGDSLKPHIETSASFHEYVTGRENAQEMIKVIGVMTEGDWRPGVTMAVDDSGKEIEQTREAMKRWIYGRRGSRTGLRYFD